MCPRVIYYSLDYTLIVGAQNCWIEPKNGLRTGIPNRLQTFAKNFRLFHKTVVFGMATYPKPHITISHLARQSAIMQSNSNRPVGVKFFEAK